MIILKTKKFFTPLVEEAFGKENTAVVKIAQGGQPIRRWYKDWRPASGEFEPDTGDIYKVLIDSIKNTVQGKKLASVTFIWMQGENDAKLSHGEVYKESLLGLMEQFKKDLNINNMNTIIGRLSDYDLENKKCPHWSMIRKIQMEIAEENNNTEWVNTDDLNDATANKKPNALHYSKEGYVILGKRYADLAIKMIRKE